MKAPRGKDELLVYLDFDAVLHHESVWWHPRRGIYLEAPEGHRLFQHVELLERTLSPYPQVKLVLSTSWVRMCGFSGARKRLSSGLQARVIGATYHSAMRYWGDAYAATPRGLQVLRDVERRQPADWLALDDEFQEWPSDYLDRLVKTHPERGLSEPSVLAEFEVKLARMCGRIHRTGDADANAR